MELALLAEVREGLGKQKVIKLRQNNQIPGVLYGEGKPTEHITVNAHEFDRLIVKNGTGKLISLDINSGKKAAEKTHVLIKEFQRHPVKGNVLHIDFLRVAMDHQVTVKVPVHLVGEEKRARDGAILEVLFHEMEVSCLPGNIPNRIQVDVSKLPLGSAIHVKDIQIPDVKLLNSPEEVVVMAALPTVGAEPGESGAAEPEVVGAKKEETK
ncbi:MAG TPA: 50S ribosomal protein L25 [Bacillota bacterium]|nr:50S ribosomal protein L25 [Bacillota bacterium]